MTEKPIHCQVRSPILGEFIEKVIEKIMEDGYTLKSYEAYKFGREYVADLRIPTLEADFSLNPVTTDSEKKEISGDSVEEVKEILVPDWEYMNKLVEKEDKEGLEAYAQKFSVDLNKRRSPLNMLKDFKEAVGA